MVRARSPFKLAVIVCLFILGVANGLVSSKSRSRGALESWHYDAVFLRHLDTTVAFLAILATTVMAVCLCIEIALAKGWEPKWLTKTFYGAIVVDKENDSAGFWLVVQRPDGEVERYKADLQELAAAEVGDVVKLAVVNSYVADVKVLKGETAAQMSSDLKQPGGLGDLRSRGFMLTGGSVTLIGWGLALIFPFLSGFPVASGTLTVLTHETARGYRRSTPSWIVTGWEADLEGWLHILGGLILLTISIVLWQRGWEDNSFGRTRFRFW